MFSPDHRPRTWTALQEAPLDVLVIGGGITGAGIVREAARMGLRVGLVEQRDFAWGTSSRSSKLVHGGLRYLKEGRFGLTRTSVSERERLLEEGAGLIDPLGFLLATYQGDSPGRRMYGAGLTVYDLLALQWSHRYYSAVDFQRLAPFLSPDGLQGGFRYGDAQTDDARLVLRVLSEAAGDGALILNYARVTELLTDARGRVTGARVRDTAGEAGKQHDLAATVVVNATGAWADALRSQVGGAARIRPLRGSHLLFPAWRLPVEQALSFLHPLDRRPVFIFPWEGITLVGTTDVDHAETLEGEPRISPDEVSYLMAAVASQFPGIDLALEDVVSTFSGIRPVIGSGKSDPSKESRDHVVWEEHGLLTVTGGKLTTFRRIALDALRTAQKQLPHMGELDSSAPVFNPPCRNLLRIAMPEADRRRLIGRYGGNAAPLLEAAGAGETEHVGQTATMWAEVRWAARAEGVIHLDDLLLRRTRLGLLLPDGAGDHLDRVGSICRAELGWGNARWQQEALAYEMLHRECYGVPAGADAAGWHALLDEARTTSMNRILRRKRRRRRWVKGGIASGAVSGAGLLIGLGRWAWTKRAKPRRSP